MSRRTQLHCQPFSPFKIARIINETERKNVAIEYFQRKLFLSDFMRVNVHTELIAHYSLYIDIQAITVMDLMTLTGVNI